MANGHFIISLDFELYWGVRDKLTLEQYGANIRGVHTVIPRLLDMFAQYGINASFATVGLLFFNNKEEMLAGLPERKPEYNHQHLSPYNHIHTIGADTQSDPHHYAPLLIEKILQHPQHELATHTFSHYYCLEEGQTVADFAADLAAAKNIAAKYGVTLTSLVFPRNQFNDTYLAECARAGITAIRGNESSWLYAARNDAGENSLRRLFRLLDAYINISGHHCYALNNIVPHVPVNLPASRFLRPHHPVLKWLDGVKLQRIIRSMTYAAKNKQVYHLWWHPHNFGIHQDENFLFLAKILKHYQYLHQQYGFESSTMQSLANKIMNHA